VPFRLIAIAIPLAALSGVPGLFLPRASRWGQAIAAGLVCLSAAFGLAGSGIGLFSGATASYALPWQAVGGSLVGLDPLSAFFLLLVFLQGALGSIYGLGYWPQSRNPRTARKLQLFWGTIMAGMSLVVVARQAFAFLLGWEVMALSAFFLVSTEDGKGECRKSGLVYLIATHVGTLILFGFFSLWRGATGSFFLSPALAGSVSTAAANAMFFLAFIGFGMKAGMMPLHFWLPGAHANAPSHVSGMLSGVMLKMGIYGLVRTLWLLPGLPALWGWIALFSGAASALLGVAFAIAQHDIKRLLAYHSVENIGIILMGLGLAMLGRSEGRPELMSLGMAGCLLHVWNHCLFKTLLFFGAGSVLRAAGTRTMDDLGGLAKRMPWTAALFFLGAAAICGLPPLNGFVSELLIFLGLFGGLNSSWRGGTIAALAGPALAMVGAMALACFAKAYGIVFSGEPRSPRAARAAESSPSMILPMLVLAGLCLLIGMAPVLFVPALDAVVSTWSGSAIPIPAPLGSLGWLYLAAIPACALILLIARAIRRPRGSGPTWDCGYAKPDPRMQYTASSFARSIAALFAWALKPKTRAPEIQGAFPASSSLESHVDELILDRALEPGFKALKERFAWFRRFQQGQTHSYIALILVALAAMLATLVPARQIVAALLSK
jgi:hydrogenase-4 component B